MATNKETLTALFTKITSLAPNAPTVEDYAILAKGSEEVVQLVVESDLVVGQKAAKAAIINKGNALIAASTSALEMGYLSKVLQNYLVKAPSSGSFVPASLTGPSGHIHDTVNDKWYPLGHGIPVVQGARRRVICTGNPTEGGSVYRYLDESNSALFEDGTSALAYIAGGVIDGTLGTYQVYVEEPRWYRVMEMVGQFYFYACSLTPFTITTPYGTILKSETQESFRKQGWTAEADGTNAANEIKIRYKPAFEAVYFDNDAVTQKTVSIGNLQTNGIVVDLVNDKMLSIANLSLYLQPATYMTRATARTLIANGISKQQHWWTYSATRLLYLCEYGNHNSQAEIGGYTEGGAFSYGKVAPTGTTLSLGNKTGVILNNGAIIPSISGVSSSAVIGMSYRGEENIFGNIWKWCDGINISNRAAFVCDMNDTYADNVFTGEYVQLGIAQPSINGYQSTIQNKSFLVQSIGSSSIKDITDYYTQNPGSIVVILGGALSAGSIAGLSALSCPYASSGLDATIGAR